MHIVPGSTDVSIDIRAMTSAGVSLEGKVAADFTIWYRRAGAKVAIELSDLSALTDAHADGGIKEIDDGAYRLDLPDAVCAAGVNVATVGGTVDGGIVLQMPIDLTAGVPQTGDTYPIASHTDYGLAKLVRSETPANKLVVDAQGRAKAKMPFAT